MKTRLHKKIYPARAVKTAVAAFSEVASISTLRDGDYTIVDLQSGDAADDAEFMGEFENFVLGETISMRGVK
ncbi:MAG TPA: HxsD-like protein [Myxococcota bacterium]|nr:HxsD-like protein [Myxococcota bacterium]HNZ02726.1 HxsD-like protein [Myxococcota bacterium]HOD06909.1 HxsD-like protein [Myxococcota bacterium]HPB50186.1 HxsD-like protein [Myxococcota bacterium]HQP95032.1 HxsD-like protein [Myxococcota bacterium]